MAGVRESGEHPLSGCFNDPCGSTDKMFAELRSRRPNLRDPGRPAEQNSAPALYIPRRRELAAEGKDAALNAPMIGPALNEFSNATIGTGRRLKPLFNAARLGWTAEQEIEVSDAAKTLFSAHMNSKRKWIDQEGDQTLAAMERSVLENTIAAGEQYTLAFWFTDPIRPFRTALALIDEDRVRDPISGLTDQERENVIAGHRFGPSGRTRSYFVHGYHRRDPRNKDPEDFTEVSRYNEFGREQVIHTFLKKQPGLSRGLSHLTSAFSKLKCLEKYEKTRMEAAIMQTAMAFVIKSNDKNLLGQISGGGMGLSEADLKKMYAFSMKKALDSQKYLNGNQLNVDGVKGIRLLENEDAELLTGSDAGVNDKQFVDSCWASIARSVGHSRSTVTQDFEKSYSAARAALISFYAEVEKLAEFIVDDWLRSVYTIWLEDVILSGQLPIPNYPDPVDAWAHFILNREWYCEAQFCGPAKREIDQAKAMTFWRERKNLGSFTFQEFYDAYGRDWQQELRQQFKEMKFLDFLISECDFEHIDPIAFMQGKLEAVVVEPPEPNTGGTSAGQTADRDGDGIIGE